MLIVTIIYIVSITILFVHCYKVKKAQKAADENRRILIDHATALLIKQEYFISAICNGNIHDPGFTIEISHFLTDYVFKCILKGAFESEGIEKAHLWLVMKYTELFEIYNMMENKASLTSRIQKWKDVEKNRVKRFELENGDVWEKYVVWRQAEKMLLTWLISDRDIFDKVAAYIKPEDFIDPLFSGVAEKVYEQYGTGNISPAAIIADYATTEEHTEVAAMFSADLDESLNNLEREKTLNDIVIRIKANSLNHELNKTVDPKRMQEIIIEQQKLNQIHIKL